MNKRLLIILISLFLIVIGIIFIFIKTNNDNHIIISKINLEIEKGNINQVKKLIKDVNINQVYKGNDCYDEMSDNYYCVTPLTMACITGQYETVKLLIENGADVNYKENKKWYNERTPLIFTVEEADKNKYKIVKYLLDNGADKNIKTTYGQSALDIAKSNNDKKMIDLLS